MTYRATTVVPTDRGGQYLRQLAKHFERRVAVVVDGDQATVAFPSGGATMDATPESLTVHIEAADAEAAAGPKGAVERHLISFAKGRVTEVTWHEAGQAA